jgi:hypothetical protein
MQHATQRATNMQQSEIKGTDDDLVSISEAARQLGLDKSTLSRQIKAKRIRSHGGKVRVAEVRADRSANIAFQIRRNTQRNGVAQTETVAPICATARNGATVDEDDERERLDDNAPIGPGPYMCITNIPLTQGLVSQLAALIQTEEPGNLVTIGQDLISIGSDILAQTIEAQRATYAEIKNG